MPRAATKEDIEDLKVAESMRDLIASPGWKVYEKVLQKHIDDKMSDMLQPLHPIRDLDGALKMGDGLSHVLVGEAAKGAILGLRLALSLPGGIVTGAQQIRARLRPEDADVGSE